MKYVEKRIFAFVIALIAVMTLLSGCAEGGRNAQDTGLSGLETGQHIYFGSYPQSGSEPEPIEWRVLDVQDGKALILSEKLLDCRTYDRKRRDTTWEKCSLRGWMNGDFMKKAFSGAETESMIEVTNPNPAPPEEGNTGGLYAEGGNDTMDKVFCLSYDEVMKYLPGEDDRRAAITPYATSRGAASVDEVTGEWWLRTSGYDNLWAMCVKFNGAVDTDGHGVDFDDVAVRPAMWVRISQE